MSDRHRLNDFLRLFLDEGEDKHAQTANPQKSHALKLEHTAETQ